MKKVHKIYHEYKSSPNYISRLAFRRQLHMHYYQWGQTMFIHNRSPYKKKLGRLNHNRELSASELQHRTLLRILSILLWMTIASACLHVDYNTWPIQNNYPLGCKFTYCLVINLVINPWNCTQKWLQVAAGREQTDSQFGVEGLSKGFSGEEWLGCFYWVGLLFNPTFTINPLVWIRCQEESSSPWAFTGKENSFLTSKETHSSLKIYI